MGNMADGGNLSEILTELKDVGGKLKSLEADRETVVKTLRDDQAKLGQASADTLAKVDKMEREVGGLVLKHQTLETSYNELYARLNRPGAELRGGEKERNNGIEYCRLAFETKNAKRDPLNPFKPSEEQIAEAIIAYKAMSKLCNTTDFQTLSPEDRKSLSAFSFGNNAFFLAPEMNSRVLSCLIDQTDIAGLMSSMTISGPSVRFLIDNVEFDQANWACEASCFANNPQPLLSGLGELEIKPETLRYIICTTRDILEDASVNIETWMMDKVNRAIRRTVSCALISGDGIGKPMGILNPNAGIPIANTSPATPAGTFTWMDLVSLMYSLPQQYQNGARWLMNQRTFGLCMSMSDANGRPIFSQIPDANLHWGLTLLGKPVTISTQMPDVAQGATPIAYGNLAEAYMVVNRKAVTLQQDPYSAGFCILFKFEARIGGGIICPGAMRLLRIS